MKFYQKKLTIIIYIIVKTEIKERISFIICKNNIGTCKNICFVMYNIYLPVQIIYHFVVYHIILQSWKNS